MSLKHAKENSAHVRQSRPDYGLGFRFQVKLVHSFEVGPHLFPGEAGDLFTLDGHAK